MQGRKGLWRRQIKNYGNITKKRRSDTSSQFFAAEKKNYTKGRRRRRLERTRRKKLKEQGKKERSSKVSKQRISNTGEPRSLSSEARPPYIPPLLPNGGSHRPTHDQPGAMDKLPAEVFNGLLDQLESRGGRDGPTTNPRRNPWALPQPYRPDHIDSRQHFSALRLVCRRFNELTAPYLFRSIGLRFNQKSFKRLESLAANPQLSKHVRKFVYLMPYLYEEGAPSLCRRSPAVRTSLWKSANI